MYKYTEDSVKRIGLENGFNMSSFEAMEVLKNTFKSCPEDEITDEIVLFEIANYYIYS
jgi:hypothetical protein